MRFAEKVAIITGAGQGIGRATAEQFLAEGAAVILAEVNAEAGTRAEGLLAPRGRVRFLQTDVANEESVRAMVSETLRLFGRIDALVNNAAVTVGGPVTGLSLADWNRVLAVNLTGPFLCAKHAGPHLAAAHGAIVNIASTRALMSEPNSEAYAASKGGLLALTHSLAVSLGPEIRVNAICPGWIDVRALRHNAGPTPALRPIDHSQHPAGRVGRPEDIASLVLYLCSEDAGFLTGQTFVADGGITRKMIYKE